MKTVKKGSFLIETLMAMALISIIGVMLLPSLTSLVNQQSHIINKYEMLHLGESTMEKAVGKVYSQANATSYSEDYDNYKVNVTINNQSDLKNIVVTVIPKDDENEKISFESFISEKGLYSN